MRKIFFWATVISGVTAAVLMLRRGASLTSVAQQATQNPIGSLVNELQSA